MIDFLQTIGAFLLALGVLVTIHEFGHFWVARKVGVKILRFSVGFGRPLWRRVSGADKTEFVIAMVPLGGYVKMLDEREGAVAADELPRAFNQQELWARTAIVAAGPLANFLLAIAAYWLMFVIGIGGPSPIIGKLSAGSIADRAGLTVGAEIKQIDEQDTPTWEAVFRRSLDGVLDSREVSVTYVDVDGYERSSVLDFSLVTVDDITEGDFFTELGAEPLRRKIPARIAKLVSGGAAERDGLKVGDEVISADGENIEGWSAWVEVVRASAGQALAVGVLRDGLPVSLTITPAVVVDNGERIGRIGAEVERPENLEALPQGVEHFGVFEGFYRAVARTADMTWTTLKFLYKMIAGQASVKNLSGPISIAQFAGQSAELGLPRFLDFLALVSVSLAVLNLLPIPLLDGGHLLFYLIEFVTRRPVSETWQMYGQQLGMVMLLGLMGLAVYNDIMRLM
ncbi:MAG: RIP metalloprotease RseP [Pseudomonadota bacterium]